MNSTPCSPSSIMLLTAFPPPPPTPNTLMTAWQRFSSMIVNSLDFPSSRSIVSIRSPFLKPGFRYQKNSDRYFFTRLMIPAEGVSSCCSTTVSAALAP